MPWQSTSNLVHADGIVYYADFDGKLLAVPVAGGARRVVAEEVYGLVLWIEGDRLFWGRGDMGNRYFRVPRAGGAPELVLDGTAGRADAGIPQVHSHLRSPTDFFWAESSRAALRGPTTLWRAPRSGGPATELARFELGAHGKPPYFQGAALAADAIVLADNGGFAWTVPLAGGPAVALAMPQAKPPATPTFLGVDHTGVYWAVDTETSPEPWQEREVVVSPADGGPTTPFWSPLPPAGGVDAMWPDGDGGWFVSTFQRYAGEVEARHTIWSVDAGGSRRRLACSPGAYLDSYILEPPAVAADAFYFIARGGTNMQIVRVPRF